MHTITFMRHAEAQNHAETGDHGRPLSPRGRDEALSIANQLAQYPHWLPDIVLVSTALRTRETCQLLSLKPELKVCFSKDLYHTSMDSILKVMANEAISANHVMIIGHNSGISDVASKLTKKMISMRTAQVIVMNCSLEAKGIVESLYLGEWNESLCLMP